MLPINQSFDKIWEKFEKNLRHQSYISMKKHQLTLQNAGQWPAHMTHTTGTTGTTVVVLLSYYTVQLQAWCIHCPISAQIRLVIISHIPYFWYSCDQYSNRTLCHLIHNSKFIIIIVIKKSNSHFYDHSIDLRWSQTPLGPRSSLAFQDSICRKSDLHMQHNKWNRRDKT